LEIETKSEKTLETTLMQDVYDNKGTKNPVEASVSKFSEMYL